METSRLICVLTAMVDCCVKKVAMVDGCADDHFGRQFFFLFFGTMKWSREEEKQTGEKR